MATSDTLHCVNGSLQLRIFKTHTPLLDRATRQGTLVGTAQMQTGFGPSVQCSRRNRDLSLLEGMIGDEPNGTLEKDSLHIDI
jgi:hypothetical protein